MDRGAPFSQLERTQLDSSRPSTLPITSPSRDIAHGLNTRVDGQEGEAKGKEGSRESRNEGSAGTSTSPRNVVKGTVRSREASADSSFNTSFGSTSSTTTSHWSPSTKLRSIFARNRQVSNTSSIDSFASPDVDALSEPFATNSPTTSNSTSTLSPEKKSRPFNPRSPSSASSTRSWTRSLSSPLKNRTSILEPRSQTPAPTGPLNDEEESAVGVVRRRSKVGRKGREGNHNSTRSKTLSLFSLAPSLFTNTNTSRTGEGEEDQEDKIEMESEEDIIHISKSPQRTRMANRHERNPSTTSARSNGTVDSVKTLHIIHPDSIPPSPSLDSTTDSRQRFESPPKPEPPKPIEPSSIPFPQATLSPSAVPRTSNHARASSGATLHIVDPRILIVDDKIPPVPPLPSSRSTSVSTSTPTKASRSNLPSTPSSKGLTPPPHPPRLTKKGSLSDLGESALKAFSSALTTGMGMVRSSSSSSIGTFDGSEKSSYGGGGGGQHVRSSSRNRLSLLSNSNELRSGFSSSSASEAGGGGGGGVTNWRRDGGKLVSRGGGGGGGDDTEELTEEELRSWKKIDTQGVHRRARSRNSSIDLLTYGGGGSDDGGGGYGRRRRQSSNRSFLDGEGSSLGIGLGVKVSSVDDLRRYDGDYDRDYGDDDDYGDEVLVIDRTKSRNFSTLLGGTYDSFAPTSSHQPHLRPSPLLEVSPTSQATPRFTTSNTLEPPAFDNRHLGSSPSSVGSDEALWLDASNYPNSFPNSPLPPSSSTPNPQSYSSSTTKEVKRSAFSESLTNPSPIQPSAEVFSNSSTFGSGSGDNRRRHSLIPLSPRVAEQQRRDSQLFNGSGLAVGMDEFDQRFIGGVEGYSEREEETRITKPEDIEEIWTTLPAGQNDTQSVAFTSLSIVDR